MDEFINRLVHLDFTTWAILLIAVGLLIKGLFGFVKRNWKKWGIKKVELPGGFKAEFSEDDDEGSGKEESSGRKGTPHSRCIYVKDVLQSLTRTSIITSQIDRIKNKEILQMQMKFSEGKLSQIKGKLKTTYMNRMSEIIGKGSNNSERLSANKDYKNYSNLVDLLIKETFDVMRSEFLNPSFKKLASSQKEITEFDEMISDAFRTMKTEWSSYFDMMYTGDDTITRNDLQTVLKGIYPDLKTDLRASYLRGKEILVTKLMEVEKLKDDLNKFVSEKIGEPVS